jgi:hypothetical protein
MISFMNMNKRPLNGEPEEDEDDSVPGEKKPVPPRAFMSWQDALVLLVIVGLCVGGYKYYQYSKQKSADTFAKCAQLYDAKNWLEAENCYDSTWKLSYVTASLDSLRSLRLGLIQDMRNAQLDVYEAADAYWNDGDSVKAIAEMEKLVLPFLLDEEKHDVWKKWEVIAAIRNAAVPQQ